MCSLSHHSTAEPFLKSKRYSPHGDAPQSQLAAECASDAKGKGEESQGARGKGQGPARG